MVNVSYHSAFRFRNPQSALRIPRFHVPILPLPAAPFLQSLKVFYGKSGPFLQSLKISSAGVLFRHLTAFPRDPASQSPKPTIVFRFPLSAFAPLIRHPSILILESSTSSILPNPQSAIRNPQSAFF